MRNTIRRYVAGSAMAFTVLAGTAAFIPSAMAQSQAATTTTVTASPSSAATGQDVTLSANVSGCKDPTSSLGMSFFDGGTLLQTVPIDSSGDASLTTSFSTTGTHDITAVFNASSDCAASSGTATVDVASKPTPVLPGLINISTGDIGILGNNKTETNSHNNTSNNIGNKNNSAINSGNK